MILRSIAERTDLSLRTFSARRTAADIFDAFEPYLDSGEEALLERLSQLRSWSRPEPARFICRFGERSMPLSIPTPFNPAAFLRLVTRTEINVCLGDSDPSLLPELHSIAQRELEALMRSR